MAPILVFDIESVLDGDLLSRSRYAKDNVSPAEAIRLARQEALGKSDGKSDFVPVTFHVPIVVGYILAKDSTLEPLYEPTAIIGSGEDITRRFWTDVYPKAKTFVTFNGRGFDFPLMEIMAYRHGVVIPESYFAKYGPRNRYSNDHIDLFDWFSNYGAVRGVGGLNELSQMAGRPGKTDMCGRDVADLYDKGEIGKIRDYCLRDVVDTFAVYLRHLVMVGQITKEEEARAIKHF